MKTETIINLLISMRATIDAILEELGSEIQDKDNKGCTHPMDYRQNLSVLGTSKKKYRCKICGLEWEEEAGSAVEQ